MVSPASRLRAEADPLTAATMMAAAAAGSEVAQPGGPLPPRSRRVRLHPGHDAATAV
jgi:hypothetical protein